MKRILFCLLACFEIIYTPTTNAATPWGDVDIDIEDLGPQQIKEATDRGPWSIEFIGDYIGEANVTCPSLSNLTFATAQADLSVVYYYDPCYQEGLTLGLDYTWTRLDWNANPYFTQEDFSMVSLNLGGFSLRLPNWTWRGQLSINFDNIECWNFSDYMSYDLLLWGRYALCQNFGVHIGFLALTGMKIDRVYPIIGFDWTYDKWQLNLAFPVDLSLTYNINSCWNVALAGRFFNQRHRVKDDQTYPEGLWFYTTGGGELALNYQPSTHFKANIHAGANLGGHLKIANRHYENGHRYSLGTAPYAGGEVDFNF
ncbi:MAG: hypothetical protein WCG42_09800 [Parachlamydiaceae bacterium]